MSMRLPLDARIYVAGHDSPLGRMLCRKLRASGYDNVITREAHELNLRNQLDVNLFFEQELPDYVFLVNDHTSGQVAQVVNPAEFLYGRMLGLSNVIHASYVYEVRKLLNIIFTLDGASGLPTAHASDPAEDPSTETLIELLTLGMCDRYRRQYDCDFISARFHLDVLDETLPGRQIPAVLPGNWASSDQLYALDPTDACLFLMEHFSSAGAISVRSGAGSFASP
ncbi:GDP-L-fucose synthase [Deinococcus metalli]|uniref:GDP-L-fucose synthase n=1 Tax=Deinococcus metalli TaxID=1141878 RepID=A0A7W8KDG9_9DEIO|nr:NAD-dependent epimerase/dehydratase family protein [Deinococcus metalli]MBB5375930.1 GDP-L-fucose synthase [Deinococcus metalli]GHF36016.1 GDP-L-fucose synthase [Deinococcus metalli]